MSQGIISKISKINQVLFFLCLCTIIIIFLVNIIPDLVKNFEPTHGPKLVTHQPEGKNSTRAITQIQHLDYINETHVFKVRSNQVVQAKKSEGISNMFSMVNDGLSLVNFYFLDTKDNQWETFNQDTYIKQYNIAELGPKPIHEYGDNLFKLSKNIYLTITQDSNQDGYLTDEDQIDIYTSSWNGKNLKQINSDVRRYDVIQDDLILIEGRAGGYSTYDLNNEELRPLKIK